MSDNSNDLGAFLAGFVIGGLVGAATALILAPQSGEETRSQIIGKSGDWRHSGGQRFQQYREAASSRSQNYREQASNFVTDARTRAQETGGKFQEQARIVLDSGKERAAQVKDQVNTYVQKEEPEAGEDGAPETAE